MTFIYSLDSVSQVSNIILDGVTKDDDEEDDRFIVDDSAPRIFENELVPHFLFLVFEFESNTDDSSTDGWVFVESIC